MHGKGEGGRLLLLFSAMEMDFCGFGGLRGGGEKENRGEARNHLTPRMIPQECGLDPPTVACTKLNATPHITPLSSSVPGKARGA